MAGSSASTASGGGSSKGKMLKRDKTLACNFCAMTFNKKEHLQRHERTHTLDRPYACDFPDCGKTFARRDTLTRHTRLHKRDDDEMDTSAASAATPVLAEEDVPEEKPASRKRKQRATPSSIPSTSSSARKSAGSDSDRAATASPASGEPHDFDRDDGDSPEPMLAESNKRFAPTLKLTLSSEREKKPIPSAAALAAAAAPLAHQPGHSFATPALVYNFGEWNTKQKKPPVHPNGSSANTTPSPTFATSPPSYAFPATEPPMNSLGLDIALPTAAEVPIFPSRAIPTDQIHPDDPRLGGIGIFPASRAAHFIQHQQYQPYARPDGHQQQPQHQQYQQPAPPALQQQPPPHATSPITPISPVSAALPATNGAGQGQSFLARGPGGTHPSQLLAKLESLTGAGLARSHPAPPLHTIPLPDPRAYSPDTSSPTSATSATSLFSLGFAASSPATDASSLPSSAGSFSAALPAAPYKESTFDAYYFGGNSEVNVFKDNYAAPMRTLGRGLHYPRAPLAGQTDQDRMLMLLHGGDAPSDDLRWDSRPCSPPFASNFSGGSDNTFPSDSSNSPSTTSFMDLNDTESMHASLFGDKTLSPAAPITADSPIASLEEWLIRQGDVTFD